MHPDCTVDQCCRHCGNSQSSDNFPNTIDMPESLWKVAQSPASTCSILCQSLVNSRQAPLQLSQKGSSDFLDKISKWYQTHQDFLQQTLRKSSFWLQDLQDFSGKQVGEGSFGAAILCQHDSEKERDTKAGTQVFGSLMSTVFLRRLMF